MTVLNLEAVDLINGLTPIPEPLPEPIPDIFPPRGVDLEFRPLNPIDRFRVPIFRRCTPKILVVTDSLSFGAGGSGLNEFVKTLRTNAIHGMLPDVRTAKYSSNLATTLSYDAATKHISNFHFTDSTHGLLKSRYDVVFILSSQGANLSAETGALKRIVDFMQAGGGLFCTGDHSTLGAGMCKDIPRVNKMRKWTVTDDVPSSGGDDRLTTNLPGVNNTYENFDQSDAFPQRLFANYRSVAGGFNSASSATGKAHPVLQIPGGRVVEVFPDHPHEGECLVPASASGTLPGTRTPEWPDGLLPEMVALTMSHGNGSGGKEAVVPRSFIAISAYDGHEAEVGRVVTDATWHHFVNLNIMNLAGMNLSDIQQYYVNLAVWLMPKKVRRCLRSPWALSAATTTALLEELPNVPVKDLKPAQLLEVGSLAQAAFLKQHTEAEVNAFMTDALEEAVGKSDVKKLLEANNECFEKAGLVALGTFVLATAERFNELVEKGDVNAKGDLDGEKAFAGVGQKEASRAVKAFLKDDVKALNQQVKAMSDLL